MKKKWMVGDDDLGGASGGGIVDGTVQPMAEQDGGHLRVRRQSASAGYQFQRHLRQAAAGDFSENPDFHSEEYQ